MAATAATQSEPRHRLQPAGALPLPPRLIALTAGTALLSGLLAPVMLFRQVRSDTPVVSAGAALGLLAALTCRRWLPAALILVLGTVAVATVTAVLADTSPRDTVYRCAAALAEESAGVAIQAIVLLVVLSGTAVLNRIRS